MSVDLRRRPRKIGRWHIATDLLWGDPHALMEVQRSVLIVDVVHDPVLKRSTFTGLGEAFSEIPVDGEIPLYAPQFALLPVGLLLTGWRPG